jgi:GH15 family glucan-1,4-alpha-glucosidase
MRLGYRDEIERFFDFCRRALHPNGYLSHKYRSDGALGSSWHTYVHGSRVAPPIQTDETALVLFSFSQYYHQHMSEKLLAEYYETLVKPMAEFLATYIDSETHLPSPSYDLWEEQFITSTYTTAVTHAALQAAAELAEAAEDQQAAVAWRLAAEDMYQAAHARLYSAEKGHLRKGLRPTDDGYENDDTIDMSALFGAFMFGLYDINDPVITSSMQAAAQRFNQERAVGLPRYEEDMYRREEGQDSNFWHVTTLWYAQYLLETNDVEAAARSIEWSLTHSYASGIMAEQILPESGYSTSVAPLAWSHAEFMATLLDYMANEGDDA